jgi:hypothetical protein
MRSVVIWIIVLISVVALVVTNAAYPLLALLLTGSIPGTNFTIAPSLMIALFLIVGIIIVIRTAWMLIGFTRTASLAYKQQHRLPRRRYQV